MTKQIQLSEILDFSDPGEYKVHLQSNNGKGHPLVLFLYDKEECQKWNTYGITGNEWSRRYIFNLIDFYHEDNVWLFGGIFEVLDRHKAEEEWYKIRYDIKITNKYKSMIGRLKVYFERSRTKHRKMESILENLFVHEILHSEYEGEAFCGYEKINHSFQTLEQIFNIPKLDWKAALENIEGVYMIMDKSNGKKYVGSAYGESGVWSRWSEYLDAGHGNNAELTKIISRKGKEYAQENFVFSLLEWRSMGTYSREQMPERESHWKETLLSREFGYNSN